MKYRISIVELFRSFECLIISVTLLGSFGVYLTRLNAFLNQKLLLRAVRVDREVARDQKEEITRHLSPKLVDRHPADQACFVTDHAYRQHLARARRRFSSVSGTPSDPTFSIVKEGARGKHARLLERGWNMRCGQTDLFKGQTRHPVCRITL